MNGNDDWKLVGTPGQRFFLPAAVLAAADRSSHSTGRLPRDDPQSAVSASARSRPQAWMARVPQTVSLRKSRSNQWRRVFGPGRALAGPLICQVGPCQSISQSINPFAPQIRLCWPLCAFTNYIFLLTYYKYCYQRVSVCLSFCVDRSAKYRYQRVCVCQWSGRPWTKP